MEATDDEPGSVDHLDLTRAARFSGDDGVFARDGSALFAGGRRRAFFSGPFLFPSLSGRQSLRARSAMDDGAGDHGAVVRDVNGPTFERRARGMAQSGVAGRRAVALLPRQLRSDPAR